MSFCTKYLLNIATFTTPNPSRQEIFRMLYIILIYNLRASRSPIVHKGHRRTHRGVRFNSASSPRVHACNSIPSWHTGEGLWGLKLYECDGTNRQVTFDEAGRQNSSSSHALFLSGCSPGESFVMRYTEVADQDSGAQATGE